jgi:hypothetical protein
VFFTCAAGQGAAAAGTATASSKEAIARKRTSSWSRHAPKDP